MGLGWWWLFCCGSICIQEGLPKRIVRRGWGFRREGLGHPATPPASPGSSTPVALGLCWEAQRLLSYLLMSRPTSAGSALFLLLPWWVGPCGMSAHPICFQQCGCPQPVSHHGCLLLPQQERLGPGERCFWTNSIPYAPIGMHYQAGRVSLAIWLRQ